MKYIKIIALGLGFVILSTLTYIGFANAQSFKAGNTVTVAKKEMIDSMLFAGGSNIDIAGTVNGDLYCAGQNISISGVVNGDVICAGQNILISGKIEGSVRLASQSVNISGRIVKNATIGTQTLTIDKGGSIGRDLLGGSQNVIVNGSIARDIVSGSSNLTINGTVGRNIRGVADEVLIGSSGQVYGNVEYTGTNDPTINSGGYIKGIVKRTDIKDDDKSVESNLFASMAWLFAYKLIAMLIFSMVILIVLPKLFDESSSETIKSPGRAVLIGAAATFLMPLLIIILLMTLVGIPLALLAILLWIVIMILICPFAGFTLGRVLFKNIKKPIWIMVLGVTLLIVIGVIPIIGFIAMIFAYLFGTGMILIQGKKLLLQPKLKK